MKPLFYLAGFFVAATFAVAIVCGDDFIKTDKDKREVRVAAETTKRTTPQGKAWPIEVFLCVERGKMHETVFHTSAKPSELHKALESIGLKKGEPALPAESTENGKYVEPKGDKVDVFVEWTNTDGKMRREPWNKMVVTGQGSGDPTKSVQRGEMKEVAAMSWLFVGSRMGINPDSGAPIYGADDNKSIATVNHNDVTAVLQLPGGDKEGFIFDTSTAVPPPGTKVTLILRPAQ